jgi:O-antigen ligase
MTAQIPTSTKVRFWIPFFSLLVGGVTISVGGKHPDLLYFDVVFGIWLAYQTLWKGFRPRFSDPVIILGCFCLLVGLVSTVTNYRDIYRGIVAAKVLGMGILVYAIARTAPIGLITPSIFGVCTSALLFQKYEAMRYGIYEGVAGLKDEIGISLGRSNYVASILILLIPLAVAGACIYRSKIRWILIPATMLMCAGLLVTMSRGAILATLCATLLSWPLFRKAGIRIKHALLVLVLLGLTVIAIPRDLLETDVALFAYRLDNPDYSRQEIMKASLESFLENPFLGVGPGQLGNAIAHHLMVPQYDVSYYNAHNLIIDSIAEMGLPAGLALLTMVGIVLRNAWTAAFKSPNAVNLAIWMALFSAVIHNMVEASFAGAQFQVVFWSIAAMAGNMPERTNA